METQPMLVFVLKRVQFKKTVKRLELLIRKEILSLDI